MKESQYYKSLDIMKFLCAIIIACIYHYQNDFPDVSLFSKIPIISQLSYNGYMLVELFFIFSGFLFITRYFKKIKNEELSLKDFMIKRYKKLIFVAGVTSVVMFVLQQLYYLKNGSFWIWNQNDIGSLLLQFSGFQYWFTPNAVSLNNAVWYISILLFCYVIYFLVSKVSIKKKNIFFFLIPIIFAFFVQYYFCNISNITRGVMSFGVGIFIGLLSQKLKNNKKMFAFSFISLLLLCICYIVFGRQVIGNMLVFLTFVAYPLLVIFLLSIDSKLKFISNKVTKYLGSLSFGIYLWNLPIQLATIYLDQVFGFNFNYSSISFFVIQVVIHIIVAIISNYLFERKVSCFFEKKIATIIEYCSRLNKLFN